MDTSKIDPDTMTVDEQAVLDAMWLEGVMDDPEVIKKGVAVILDTKG